MLNCAPRASRSHLTPTGPLGALALVALTFAGLTSATAQSPPVPGASPQQAGVELSLQALHSLPTQGVYSLQPLQPGTEPPAERRGKQDPPPTERSQTPEGSTAARLFATIGDGRFDAAGQLLYLLVAPAVVDPRSEPVVRVLPAAAVRWDDGRRQWLVNEPNLQFAELQAESPAPPGELPSKAPPATSLLASQLVRANLDLQPAAAPTPQPLPAGSPPKTDGSSPGATAPSAPVPVVWMAGSAQRLVLVVVPIASAQVDGKQAAKHIAVPWSLVRVTTAGGAARLRVNAAVATVHSAPEIPPTQAPTRAVRDRCYLHYGIAPPDWDAPVTAPRAAGK